MKQSCTFILFIFLSLTGRSQLIRKDTAALKAVRLTHKDTADERRINMYTNRKYSYGISENFYGFHPNSTIFHATDVVVSDRLSYLDIGNFTSFELTGGASFQPYQGFRLHLGFDYEWLTPTKVHFYIGGQYALGLKQRTIAINRLSSIIVGYHNYIMPFIGLMYWPGKRDIGRLNTKDSIEISRYYNPTFWQLVYLKSQIGYSALFSKLTVDPTQYFDEITTSNIRENVSSGLYLSFGIGINLPTFGSSKLANRNHLHYMNVY